MWLVITAAGGDRGGKKRKNWMHIHLPLGEVSEVFPTVVHVL